ncbi:MAG: class I SAM-dependent methyltransferase [Rhodobacteraceae bacterium]|uniref:class I SAM-dependent methyltransferase n=1 Tax=Accumulibacter sp. TaxID=2053492 RepID=UPI001A087B84|nr:class I SAM-dependent methyltransferase [Accumulibacter sp.]MBE2257811.1 class I SAM-dependent methyltransferase [Paracoccaceae bacterium]MCB1940564.1 class I SAM-dependent methyltransferase [Accumulibacter sp.]
MSSPEPEPENTAGVETSPPLLGPQLRQLALQFAAALAVLSLAWPYYGIRSEPLPWPQTAFAIGAVALMLATLSRQPWWWWPIHALFAPLAWAASTLAIDPGWYLLLVIVLLLVYRGAAGGQVPLYLSNRPTAAALAEFTADLPEMRFADLGAGIGSVLAPLARQRPEAAFTGVENAPATWLIGRLRTAGLANCDWRWGDLWRTDVSAHNVVYAFLSPAPMAALWAKLQRELRPGSVFISNSFAIPDVVADRVIDVDDDRQTRLYCYRLKAS